MPEHFSLDEAKKLRDAAEQPVYRPDAQRLAHKFLLESEHGLLVLEPGARALLEEIAAGPEV